MFFTNSMIAAYDKIQDITFIDDADVYDVYDDDDEEPTLVMIRSNSELMKLFVHPSE